MGSSDMHTLLSVLLGVCALSCAHVAPKDSRAVGRDARGRAISAAEVQQDVQRFTGEFLDRSAQALESAAGSLSPELELELQRRVLLHASSTLDIATGRFPGLNLLDMLVFMTLVRDAYERHWMPEVFGPAGAPLLEVLIQSEREAWALAAKVIAPKEQAQLRALIRRWQQANPERTRVELVRLPELSFVAGAAAAQSRVSGVLASVQSATRAADSAVLLGERAMFLAQRMPFLVRMQTRLGAREILADGLAQFDEKEPLLGRSEALLAQANALAQQSRQLLDRALELTPMLDASAQAARDARSATMEAQLLLRALEPLTQRLQPLLSVRSPHDGRTTGLEQVLAGSNELTRRSLDLVRRVDTLMPTGPHDARWAALEAQLDRGLRRSIAYLALLGAAWALFFWGGYYLVRRSSEKHAVHKTPPRDRGQPGARPSSAE